MNKHYNIIITRSGGIAEAAGLFLMEWSTVPPTIFIGNRTLSKALNAGFGEVSHCKVPFDYNKPFL